MLGATVTDSPTLSGYEMQHCTGLFLLQASGAAALPGAVSTWPRGLGQGVNLFPVCLALQKGA